MSDKPVLPPLEPIDRKYMSVHVMRYAEEYGLACYRKAIEDAAKVCARQLVLIANDKRLGARAYDLAYECMSEVGALGGAAPLPGERE